MFLFIMFLVSLFALGSCWTVRPCRFFSRIIRSYRFLVFGMQKNFTRSPFLSSFPLTKEKWKKGLFAVWVSIEFSVPIHIFWQRNKLVRDLFLKVHGVSFPYGYIAFPDGCCQAATQRLSLGVPPRVIFSSIINIFYPYLIIEKKKYKNLLIITSLTNKLKKWVSGHFEWAHYHFPSKICREDM